MNWLAAGALYCAAAVVAGAFGAHALAARLSTEPLALWETASRYLMYGGLGLCLIGLATRTLAHPLTAAGWSLGLGTAVFSGTVFALALGAPRWFGAITPIGGVSMIAGFALFALAAWRP